MTVDEERPSEERGFAGLSAMVSDVRGAIRNGEQPPSSSKAATPLNQTVSAGQSDSRQEPRADESGSTAVPIQAARPEHTGVKPNRVPDPIVPQVSRTEPSAAKWLLGLGAVVGVVWLLSQNAGTPPSTSSRSVLPPSGGAPTSSYAPSSSQSSGGTNQVPQQLVETRPPIGSENVLGPAEIRYCLSEDVRLGAAKEVVNSYVAAEVEMFNAMVADYNSRCSHFRYRHGALESARSEVELVRRALQQEGMARFRANSHTGRTDGQGQGRVPVPESAQSNRYGGPSVESPARSERAAPRTSIDRSAKAQTGSPLGRDRNDIASRAMPAPNEANVRRDTRYSTLSAAAAFGTVAVVQDWISRGYNIEGEAGEPPHSWRQLSTSDMTLSSGFYNKVRASTMRIRRVCRQCTMRS